MPTYYNRQTREYTVTGCFCSFGCLLAHQLSRSRVMGYDSDLVRRMYLDWWPDTEISNPRLPVREHARRYYQLRPAPQPQVLQKFGGPLTIEQFRAVSNTPGYQVNLVRTPLIVQPDTIELSRFADPQAYVQNIRPTVHIPVSLFNSLYNSEDVLVDMDGGNVLIPGLNLPAAIPGVQVSAGSVGSGAGHHPARKGGAGAAGAAGAAAGVKLEKAKQEGAGAARAQASRPRGPGGKQQTEAKTQVSKSSSAIRARDLDPARACFDGDANYAGHNFTPIRYLSPASGSLAPLDVFLEAGRCGSGMLARSINNEDGQPTGGLYFSTPIQFDEAGLKAIADVEEAYEAHRRQVDQVDANTKCTRSRISYSQDARFPPSVFISYQHDPKTHQFFCRFLDENAAPMEDVRTSNVEQYFPKGCRLGGVFRFERFSHGRGRAHSLVITPICVQVLPPLPRDAVNQGQVDLSMSGVPPKAAVSKYAQDFSSMFQGPAVAAVSVSKAAGRKRRAVSPAKYEIVIGAQPSLGEDTEEDMEL